MVQRSLQWLKQTARALKREAVVLQLAMGDPRVSLLPKVIAALTLGYLVSPIDLIPDFIPVLGLLDDLLLVPLAIKLVLWLIPSEIVKDLRSKVEMEKSQLSASPWPAVVLVFSLWTIALVYLWRILFEAMTSI